MFDLLSFFPYQELNSSTAEIFYFAYYCFSQSLVASTLKRFSKYPLGKRWRMDSQEHRCQKKIEMEN